MMKGSIKNRKKTLIYDEKTHQKLFFFKVTWKGRKKIRKKNLYMMVKKDAFGMEGENVGQKNESYEMMKKSYLEEKEKNQDKKNHI